MISTKRVITIKNEKYLTIRYEYVRKPKSIINLFYNYLRREKLAKMDNINHMQCVYYSFINKAYSDIKRVRSLTRIDKICFSLDPKDIIEKFDDNCAMLKSYSSKKIGLRAINNGKVANKWLKVVVGLLLFTIIAIDLIATISIKDYTGNQTQSISNYTFRTPRISFFNTSYTLKTGRVVGILNNATGVDRVLIHSVTNTTYTLVKPFFDPTVALSVMLAFSVFYDVGNMCNIRIL